MIAAEENPNALPEDVGDVVALAACLHYRANDLRKKNPRAAAILKIAASDLESCAGDKRGELPEGVRQSVERALAPTH